MDLGCGDGRVLHTAAQKIGCKCIGVETDEQLLTELLRLLGVADLCSWVREDITAMLFDQHASSVTVLVMYLLPHGMGALTPVICVNLLQARESGRVLRVVSMVFPFDAGAVVPVATDEEWKLQLYDTTSSVIG